MTVVYASFGLEGKMRPVVEEDAMVTPTLSGGCGNEGERAPIVKDMDKSRFEPTRVVCPALPSSFSLYTPQHVEEATLLRMTPLGRRLPSCGSRRCSLGVALAAVQR